MNIHNRITRSRTTAYWFTLARVLMAASVAALWTMPAAAEPLTAPAFDQTLALQGISFHISSPNNSSLSPVTIETTGLTLGDSTLEREADGTVVGAHVADLDNDGSPEIYIFTTSAGSGSYGGLIAYASNSRKSLSEIYLPPLDTRGGPGLGYQGHDTFTITDNTLVRRFPVYQDGDTNATPSGGTREIHYQLEPGETGWVLHLTAVSGSDSRVDSTLGHSRTPPDQQQ